MHLFAQKSTSSLLMLDDRSRTGLEGGDQLELHYFLLNQRLEGSSRVRQVYIMLQS